MSSAAEEPPPPRPGPGRPAGDESAGEGGDGNALPGFPAVRGRRPALWLLLVPAVLYGLAPVVANRVEPRVLGVPFLLAWVIAATVLSPLVIWAVARLDPAYRADAAEPLPGDPGAAPRGTEGGPA